MKQTLWHAAGHEADFAWLATKLEAKVSSEFTKLKLGIITEWLQDGSSSNLQCAFLSPAARVIKCDRPL